MGETRKIAAILVADVVGYSRLTGVDEDRTLARLRALRSDLIDPAISVHHGRVVKRTGDGILIEFRSVVDAVRCAIEVQSGMIERNAGLPPERRIEFRVGIHLGDVVEEQDGDLMGDGVNIAARLEGIAKPGAICLSEDAYRQVKARLNLAVSDLGETQLKNIAEPIRVYSLQVGVAAQAKSTPQAPSAVAERASAPLALPDKPSIAVLPFQNMSGDPEQEYFVDGMVEDIITGLSRIKWLFVIARNSTFVYKGQAIDVKRVGRELGVRYVLEGSVRKLNNRLRITGQLIDATTAAHIWAKRYDRALDDIFELQDELTMSVVGAIEPSLRQAEIERAKRKRPDSLDAYDLYLRALPNVSISMPESANKALPLLQKAIQIEPDYAAAHAAIAFCHENRYMRGGFLGDDKRAALHHARIAVATGGDDATALAIAAFVIGILEHDYNSAFDAFERALALSPSSALALSFSALIHAWAGDYATAVEQAEQSLRVSPFGSLLFVPYVGLAHAHFYAGRYEQAALAANRAAQANPQFTVPWVLRTASLAKLGRNEESRASVERLLELWPGFTIKRVLAGNFTSPERLAMLGEALRRAGLPDE